MIAAFTDRVPDDHFHSSTQTAVSREETKQRQGPKNHPQSSVVQRWKHAAELARRWSRSRTHYQENLNVCTMEHMSIVDPFNGSSARKGQAGVRIEGGEDENLLIVSPAIDGRLRDEGRV
jgi:5'-nucleotidase